MCRVLSNVENLVIECTQFSRTHVVYIMANTYQSTDYVGEKSRRQESYESFIKKLVKKNV